MKVQPVIEVYFDPAGRHSGKDGCFRARLRDFHGLHEAGPDPEYTVKRLVQNIVCHKDYKQQDGTFPVAHLPHTPETLEGYTMIRLAPYGGKALPCDWKARYAPQEDFDVESQKIASSMVSYMLYGPQRRNF